MFNAAPKLAPVPARATVGGMDLRMFVSETLQQIVGGVADAQTAISAMNNAARVNPTVRASGSSDTGAHASPVEFDIAVTVVNSSGEGERGTVGGSAGVLAVVGLKIGGSAEERSEKARRDEAVSRVKFTVQLAQPADVTVKPPVHVPSMGRGVV